MKPKYNSIPPQVVVGSALHKSWYVRLLHWINLHKLIASVVFVSLVVLVFVAIGLLTNLKPQSQPTSTPVATQSPNSVPETPVPSSAAAPTTTNDTKTNPVSTNKTKNKAPSASTSSSSEGTTSGGSDTPPASGCSGRPNASCTGPPSGTTFTDCSGGPHSDSTSNVTYDAVNIPAPVGDDHWTFSGSHVTLRNCKISGDIWFLGDDITIDHCDFTGGVSLSGTGTVNMTYSNIHDWDDAIHITSDSGPVTDVALSYNYVHSPHHTADSVCIDEDHTPHDDAIQLLGVNGITITHNTLDLGPWFLCNGFDILNSAFQIESTQGPDLNMTISDNYLNGGGFTARFYACSNTVFTNNRFGPDYHYGPVDNQDDACFTNKSGNVYDSNGAALTF